MLQQIGHKKWRVYAYDVESHNDNESIAKNETSIWLSSFIDENSKEEDESSYFYTIESWLDFLDRETSHKRTKKAQPHNNILVFIYNLSFEFSFILFVILTKRNFQWKERITPDDSYCFTSVTTKSISSVWTATLKFSKNGGQVVLRDLSKIFMGGLGNVAKAFKLPTQKGEIDYTMNRLHGHIVTKEEKHYNFCDCRIIIDILLKLKEDKDFWKSCSAAGYSCRKMIAEAYPYSYKPMKEFRKWFPMLDSVESEFLRHAVSGGITYAPSNWQFKNIIQTIGHIDAHQMHPSQMATKLFPYGKGIYFKGQEEPKDHFYICCRHVLVSYTGVILHSVIKLIGYDFGDDIELWLWDFEIPTMKKCYENLKIKYLDGYAYRSHFLPWRDYIKGNYAKRLIAKKNGDDYNEMRYKLLNNSAYGKLIEHGHATTFQNIIGDDGIEDSLEVALKKQDHLKALNATYTYIPVGACIPAYSRCYLIETALKISPDGSKIIYFDTDSIFYIKDKETDAAVAKLDTSSRLGAWGVEADIIRGQFSAPKRYKIEEKKKDGSIKATFHLAGINFNKMKEKPTYDTMDIISNRFQVQQVKRVKGGSIIIFKEKEIGVQPKYEDIYKKNAHNSQENKPSLIFKSA